jgi:hypothetical protein
MSKVMVTRFLMKDTIEMDIFNRNYKVRAESITIQLMIVCLSPADNCLY